MNQWYGEAFDRYTAALASRWGWALVGVIAAIAFVLYHRFGRERIGNRVPGWAPWAVGGVVAVLGLLWVWHLRWFGDDAFITFRYASNWADGRGLVFNPGERVEGYTNFLWVLLLTGAHLLGLSIPVAAALLCMASYVGVLYVVQRIVRRELGSRSAVSLAAIGLAFSYPFACYGTSGLETLFGALLVLLAFERALAGAHLAAGFFGIAATMAHPDHAIFYVFLGAALLARRTGWRGLIRYALPFFVLYVPYFAIRWSYFGSFFPNTYYAKSGGDPYYSQGAFYLYASALSAGLWALVPLFVYGLVRSKNRLLQYFIASAVPVYLFYIARIGGDYMLWRLLCPVFPLVFLVAELGLRDLLALQRWRLAGVGCVLAVAVVLPTSVLRSHENRWHLTDERTWHRIARLHPVRLEGKIADRVHALVDHMGDIEPKPSYAAFAIGYLAWLSDWTIVDIHGITDPVLARKPLTKRGRPGHERWASPEYIYQRGTTISSVDVHRRGKLTEIWLGAQGYRLVRYVPAIMRQLEGRPGVRFTDFERYLDDYIATLAQRSPGELARDLRFFDRYYFSVADDAARRDAIIRHMQKPPANKAHPPAPAPPPNAP